MHPAASVILFTTSTGFGYGLLIWLSMVLNLASSTAFSVTQMLIIIAIALLLITFGLLSSLGHLGHPERAWRAMSQWRTSWLSREGVFAVLVYPPTLFMGVAAYMGWAEILPILSLVVALLSLITVYCTAMIYASLKTIPAWHNCWTISGYLLYSLSTGGILLYFICHTFFNAVDPIFNSQALTFFLIIVICFSLFNKVMYFRYVKNNTNKFTKEMAIGLKGNISPLDPPHSSANYLMKEMGFVIARQKAYILRPISLIATYIIPACLLIITAYTATMPILLSTIILISCVIGIIAERYLFFAEAKHVVTLYYR